MARLILEEASLATGRAPETIETWIMAGRVEAERAGQEWLIDFRSLLNAAASEDAGLNGHATPTAAPRVPIDQPIDVGGRAAPLGRAEAVVHVTQIEPAPEPLPAAPSPVSPPAIVEAPQAALAGTVEIASTAIAALSARLEHAMGEVDRLQDERLKLALQLGYAQAQLKTAQEQLKMLEAPAEPSWFGRLWGRLTGR